MAHPLELNPYEQAQCVQMYGWKCLICSVEAKDQVGLELQHISDGVVYTDGFDGSKWVFCGKCKQTYHLTCVHPNKPDPTEWPFLCTFLECKEQAGKGRSTQVGNIQAGNCFDSSGETKTG